VDHSRIHRRIASSFRGIAGDPTLEALRRLRLLCTFVMIVPGIMIAVILAIAPAGAPQHDAPIVTAALVATAMIASGIVRWIAGKESIKPAYRLSIGVEYQIVLAFIVAFARHFMPWDPHDGYRELSPVTLIILVFAALLPNPPKRTLVISLCAAAMDPIALELNVLRGNPQPHLVQTLALCFGSFACAGIATLVSHVVYGLSNTVEAARDMGSYKLVEKLGAGGMGEVWRAEHRMLARPAAIKLIRQDASVDSAAIRRFEREAQATSALRSPHTVQLYDFGVTDEGTFYYVMELLDGLDLEQLVEAHGPLTPARAVHVLTEACHSLAEAHGRGLIHRDIKPANIYLCKLGLDADFVKVLDFGLVKPKTTDPAAGATVTMQGTFAGTPAFVAPEMVLGETEIDARADIYMLGCVAYWLLTGKLVFDTPSAVKMVFEHVHTKPAPPSSRADQPIPAALDKLVLDCLEKDPAKRPASCEELAARLEALGLDAWTQERARAWWSTREGGAEPAHSLAPTVTA